MRPVRAKAVDLLLLLVALAVGLGALGAGPLARSAQAQSGGSTPPDTAVVTDAPAPPSAESELGPGKAVILGVVEGVTEFLPVSSTGHLLVVQKLLGIGTTEATKDAADAYSIVIQGGAILAVLVLYRSRVLQVLRGIIGRDDEGRRLLIALVVAFAPAAAVGVLFEKKIKSALFAPCPIVAAWVAGGLVILWLVRSGRMQPGRTGAALTSITVRQAAIIGAAQCAALWPGTSRSLATVVAATLLGFSLSAAVEFSFLLGLVTLSAATVVDLAKDGHLIKEAYGVTDPVIGFVAAAVAAVIAVRWMVTYLQKRSFAVFGWYRFGAAAITASLILTHRV